MVLLISQRSTEYIGSIACAMVGFDGLWDGVGFLWLLMVSPLVITNLGLSRDGRARGHKSFFV
jgi:hypothetical protein